jgi:hypothetical protein
MEEPFAAAQIFTPGEAGALQLEGTVKLKSY